MKQAIPLNSSTESSRAIKTGALAFFKAVRWVGGVVAEVPAVTKQAASDIADAWEESSRPNA